MQLLKRLYFTLALTLFFGACISVTAQGGANDQRIEMEYGTTDISYPVAIEKPRGKECGGGFKDKVLPDRVLVFNTPGRGTGNPDNIKLWSDQSYIRNAVRGGLAAWGLRSMTTRACIGVTGRALSVGDYKYIYLWRRVPIARRP